MYHHVDSSVVVIAGHSSAKRSVQSDGLGKVPFWTIHRFNMRAPTTMGIGRNESPCTGLSVILS